MRKPVIKVVPHYKSGQDHLEDKDKIIASLDFHVANDKGGPSIYIGSVNNPASTGLCVIESQKMFDEERKYEKQELSSEVNKSTTSQTDVQLSLHLSKKAIFKVGFVPCAKNVMTSKQGEKVPFIEVERDLKPYNKQLKQLEPKTLESQVGLTGVFVFTYQKDRQIWAKVAFGTLHSLSMTEFTKVFNFS